MLRGNSYAMSGISTNELIILGLCVPPYIKVPCRLLRWDQVWAETAGWAPRALLMAVLRTPLARRRKNLKSGYRRSTWPQQKAAAKANADLLPWMRTSNGK